MAHKVSDACVGCGACEGACPVGAVAVENGVAVVNADACIDCGACEGACPTGAIRPVQKRVCCFLFLHKFGE